jgi:ankyrin repeat protein
MGNRSSSVQPAVGPPLLLSAAVTGDLSKFQDAWAGAEEESMQVNDHQNNTVLHALFSCRGRPDANCVEILDQIHSSCSAQVISEAYSARNHIGCTPLWILVAYGNVELLKHVQTKFEDQKEVFLGMLLVANNQGDSPFLATSSQGNTQMIQYLKEDILLASPEQFTKALALANQKGTTPLQIIVGNSHIELLKYLLESDGDSLMQEQLLQKNTDGLSLFHICSERNAYEALQLLITYMMMMMEQAKTTTKDALEQIFDLKDKNGANALHVAAFCGNQEVVQFWIDAVQKAYGDDDKAVDILDRMDSQARTAYWLAMVQGKTASGKLLADAGVDTVQHNMVKEIEEAKQEREKRVAARQSATPPVDGASLLGR